MRAILLFSALILLVAGAFLFQQYRFGGARAGETAVKQRGSPDDVVLEIGGDAPAPRIDAPAPNPVNIKLSNEPAVHVESRSASAATVADPPPKTKPEVPVSKSIKLAKNELVYKLAIKYYGSGGPAVLKDIGAASKIADVAKVAEGATIVFPAVAGGLKRKD